MATSEDIEKKLQCSICLHVLKEPKLLPCGHTFCMRCLHSHICVARSPELLQGVLGFRCAVCREFIPAPDRVSAPQSWASKYKPNYIVQEILDLHKEKRQLKLQCSRHEGKMVELYCKDCNTTVCDRCVSLQHRTCKEIVELSTVVQQRKTVLNQQLTEVTTMITQCEAKRARCETGKTELDDVERKVTRDIDRECHAILQKVTSYVRREGDRLKRDLKDQCHTGKLMVRSYRSKCEELDRVLQRVKTYLQKKLNEHNIPTNSTQQEETRVSSTLDKLGRAVQALENPCHFEVGLSLDDTSLMKILSDLHIGHVHAIKVSAKAEDVKTMEEAIYSVVTEERNISASQSTKVPVYQRPSRNSTWNKSEWGAEYSSDHYDGYETASIVYSTSDRTSLLGAEVQPNGTRTSRLSPEQPNIVLGTRRVAREILRRKSVPKTHA